MPRYVTRLVVTLQYTRKTGKKVERLILSSPILCINGSKSLLYNYFHLINFPANEVENAST